MNIDEWHRGRADQHVMRYRPDWVDDGDPIGEAAALRGMTVNDYMDAADEQWMTRIEDGRHGDE